MLALRLITRLLVVTVLIITGCNSGSNSRLESSGKVNQTDLNGLRQGPWEEYADEILIASGSYVDGLPDGLWTRWYPDGQMKEEGHYIQGVKNGMWVEWYPDGVILWKGEWEQGIRTIKSRGAKAEIVFFEETPKEHVLNMEHTYHVQIRIQNIPPAHLFVEASSGEITREEEAADRFILKTPSDSALTLAIGFMPDLEFMDFRNLVSEFDFKLR